MADNSILTPALKAPQLRALAALLTERDIRAAAKAAKVPERTLRTWLTLPAFKEALSEAMSQVMDAAIYELAGLASLAVETLRTLMTDEQVAAGVRVQAASIALARLPDLRYTKDLEERMATLEEAFSIRGEK